jgi:hypothetical protein
MPSYQRTLHSRWYHFRYKAAKRGHPVELSFEEWSTLITNAVCHYCEEPLQEKSGGGLDRKDSTLHYTKDNVVPCCINCNRMKNNILSYDEMCYLMPLLLQYRKDRS